MLDRIELRWAVPFTFTGPVPPKALFEVAIQATAKRPLRRNELWLDLNYRLIDPKSKREYLAGLYRIAFELRILRGSVEASELYEAINAALENFNIPIRKYYEEYLPGVYGINGPELQEVLPTLQACAETFNLPPTPKKERAKKT